MSVPIEQPACSAPLREPAPADQAPAGPDGPDASGQPLILVVDDDPANRALIARSLRPAGFALVEAGNGKQAVATARIAKPDLILLDVALPDIDGYEVLRSIRLESLGAYIPVIMVTGRALPQDVAEGLGTGAQDYLVKPFHRDELLARVNAAWRFKCMHDDLIDRAAALERLGRIDGLTGLHNRRHMDEVLLARLATARRRGEPLGALLVDVDHFKAVNDTFGHAVGDDVLRSVAASLADAVRGGDELGRWGGEEFLLLLPATDAQGVGALGARLRAAVAGAEPHPGVRVTVSLGGAISLGGGGNQGGAALVDAADRALYAAKKAGRDRVVVDESPAGAPGGPTQAQ